MSNPFYTSTNIYLRIYDITMDDFFKLNPPCKECLVQNMCVQLLNVNTNIRVRTRQCDILKQFLIQTFDRRFE